ncbi:MAG: dihydrodipicolinate synthase family protein [Xanthobacteraceae bacterium]
MTSSSPRGVIAAIATAVDRDGHIDAARSLALARHLLAHGCDGLNVLGTTGEATSFSVAQRMALMSAYRDAAVPLSGSVVGTGAAALADAVALTRHAAALGFGGALLLPPFYYKELTDDGLFAYVEHIVAATAAAPIPIYLYHFPALSGIPWPLKLIARLIEAFPARVRGLKDSSGNLAYAQAAADLAADFDVFPANEATLIEARGGRFAGCISATANLNADLCALAFHRGDPDALAQAVAIRGLLTGRPTVPGVKALLAHCHGDPAWAQMVPPLSALNPMERAALAAEYDAVRAGRAA